VKRAAEIAALVLAVIAFGFATRTNLRTSATWDEPVYVSAGLAYWTKADYRINREAPPLPAALGGLAALTLRPAIPFDDPSWAAGDEWRFGDALVNARNPTIAPALFHRARFPIALLGAAGVLVVFAWARRLSGGLGGVAAAALAAFSPSWLAHSAILSCDVAASVFMAAAVFAASMLALEPGALRWKRAAAFGALVFLALASKFTALLLGPLLPAIVVAIALLARRAGLATASPFALASVFARAAVVVLVLGSVVLYPGEFGLAGYGKGLSLVYKNLDPERRYFFWGSYSDHGWPHYGLASVLLKSTPEMLALAIAGAWLAVRRRGSSPELVAPLLLAAAVIAASAFDRAAFGVRRVLPAYPALFVLGGVAVGAAFEEARTSFRGKALLGLALTVVLGHVITGAWAYPDLLPYVSELAGGSERATDYFDDSNVDWGQALPDLARELEARKPARAKLLYFGRVDPAIYGVHAEPIRSFDELVHPEPRVLYAISATRLVQARGLVRDGKLAPEADWLRRFHPVARAGEAIYIYAFEERLR
jgi:4-amino-4-deoxy-L-arabinose transferase-like glycosyltransferase